LIELLVVISVMALLAGLVVLGARYAADQKKISRVTADLSKWSAMIDNYYHKLGYYPPNNPSNPYGPAVTPLFYELAGSMNNGTTYTTLTTRDAIDKTTVQAAFGVNGLANSATEQGEATSFGLNIQAADLIQVTLPGLNAPIKLPRVPVMGTPPYGNTNTWHYNSVQPQHNPNSYDLWAEIMIGGRTNIIGNWKR
jgi:type II secretory pathway pseudopilin PulG